MKKEIKKRSYGYVSNTDKPQWIYMEKGQNIAGQSIGILHIEDVYYPLLPGNVVNASTYDFPVRFKAVPNLDIPRLVSDKPDPTIFDDIMIAVKELEKEGIRAIAAACGFFANFNKQVADASEVPVALSSLVQVPWIKSTLKSNQKIGILTADASSLTDDLLRNVDADPEIVVIKDLHKAKHFSAIFEYRGSWDNTEVRKEVVNAAIELVEENEDIGAILLECSDMPPYASDIQRAVKLPVFDFITLIKWLHSATAQKPYDGFI